MKTDKFVQAKAGNIDENRLKVALKISHGRWGKTTHKVILWKLSPQNNFWKVRGSIALLPVLCLPCVYPSHAQQSGVLPTNQTKERHVCEPLERESWMGLANSLFSAFRAGFPSWEGFANPVPDSFLRSSRTWPPLVWLPE